VPTSRHNYFDDIDIPDLVSGMDLLPLPAADLYYINMHYCCQADSSTTMPNAIRGMYPLTIVHTACEVDQIGILYEVGKKSHLDRVVPTIESGYFFINFFYA